MSTDVALKCTEVDVVKPDFKSEHEVKVEPGMLPANDTSCGRSFKIDHEGKVKNESGVVKRADAVSFSACEELPSDSVSRAIGGSSMYCSIHYLIFTV